LGLGKLVGWSLVAIVVLSLAVLVALVGALSISAQQDVEAYFDRMEGAVAAVRSEVSAAEDFRIEELELLSSTGLRVEAKARYPIAGGPWPTLILVGGHRTGRNAVDLVPPMEGLVVAAISYPQEETVWSDGVGLVFQLPAARRTLFNTPPALSLLADFLISQAEVDPEKLELVGVSLGAPLAVVAGARDKRFRRVWSVHGGGDPFALLEHNLRDEIAATWLRTLSAHVGAALVAPLAPEKHAARIAPRPLVLINARSDDRIPKRSVTALYDRAREPREMIWLDGNHVDPDDDQQVGALVELVLQRMSGP